MYIPKIACTSDLILISGRTPLLWLLGKILHDICDEIDLDLIRMEDKATGRRGKHENLIINML